MELDLPAEHREIIARILAEHLPGTEVWAYGSRVRGEAHEGSDLDLVVRGKERLPFKTMTRLRAALRESALPIEVEAFDWGALPSSFHAEIEREHVVVQQATPAR